MKVVDFKMGFGTLDARFRKWNNFHVLEQKTY